MRRTADTVWLGALSDPELMERYRQGDDRAFAVLYHKYKRLLGARAYKVLRDSSLAEDAIHQALFYASHILRHTDCEVGSFRAWTSVLVRNRALTMRKRRAVQPDLFASTLDIAEPDRERVEPHMQALDQSPLPDEACHTRLVLERTLGEIQKLPAKERQVMELCSIRGLRAKEAARVMRTTEGSVWTYQERGRRRLREHLGHLRHG